MKTPALALCALCTPFLTLSTSAAIVTIFDGGTIDFSGGTAAQTDPVPADLSTGAGWGVVDDSSITSGDALRMWDNGDGRATLRYHPTAITSGLQIDFSAVILSGGTDQNHWRIGNTEVSNLAGVVRTGFDLQFKSTGDLQYYYDGGDASVSVGLDTPFDLSFVFNAANIGGANLSYNFGTTSKTLAPQEFALYLDGVEIATQTATINQSSYDPASGIGKFWFLTGPSSAAAGPIMDLDNYVLRTGSDIFVDSLGVIPEPASLSFIAGLGLLLGLVRRRKR